MVTFYWSRLMEIATPLWIGCLVVAAAAAIPTYYGVYYVVRWYRLKRWGQLIPPGAEDPLPGEAAHLAGGAGAVASRAAQPRDDAA